MFSGAITAMITPFSDGKLDEARLKAQIKRQLDEGIDGLVPVGTTGESPTLDFPEHHRVIELTVQEVAGKVPVIAGVGANSTSEALELHKFGKEVGVTAGLSVTPYYNKPSQEGLYRHYMTLADNVDLPVVLYNVPGRCGVNLLPRTVARLASHPNIVAIKEASGSCDQTSEIKLLCDLCVVSGDDTLTLPLMSVGATGVISVVSNIAPALMSQMCTHANDGDFASARKIHSKLFNLIKSLFAEGSPGGIKCAMKLAGLDSGEVRQPLAPVPDSHVQVIADDMRQAGLPVSQ